MDALVPETARACGSDGVHMTTQHCKGCRGMEVCLELVGIVGIVQRVGAREEGV